MKPLYLNVALVFLISCSSTAAAPVVDEYEDLVNIIRSLQEKTKSLEHAMEALKAVASNERERVQVLEKQIVDLTRALSDAIGSWTDDKQMTADSMFLATISEYSVPISSGDPIIWDSAPINPGEHFNTVLGMYEAPVDGYYQFSVNKEGNEYEGTFHFLVDEVQYAYKDAGFFNSNGIPSGSATINLELTAGQIVRIENIASTMILGTDSTGFMYSWFTGHLLYAL